MSRAKAVAAAIDAAFNARYEKPVAYDARCALVAAQSAYDAGYHAGMLAAGRVKHEDRPRTDHVISDAFSHAWEMGHDAHADAIRARARELARKTKGGRG